MAQPGQGRFFISSALALALAASCVVVRADDALLSSRVTRLPSSAPTAAIGLPLEVMGAAGTTASTGFNIPNGPNLNKRLKLWLKIHGLRYETEASFQLNGGPWIPLNSSTVNLQGLGSAYGGIGGGFSTLTMTLNLRVDAVQSGANTLSFRFNGTDGRTSGFRVLAFNIVASNGARLIQQASFAEDDPSRWQPPLTSADDIEAGKLLWNAASLTTPGFGSIRAKCASCHAQNGSDLKYFNYSNLSIRARSIFHGLTARQGDQIASYIRSLRVPNPGRPWNPPYQPGPGLDSQPVAFWSAGSGVDAVLESDEDLIQQLFPHGVRPNFFSPLGVLNIRETAIPLQLPDWNSWLPTIHPMDAWPDFAASSLNARYNTLRSILVPGSARAYANAAGAFESWMTDFQTFEIPKTSVAARTWNPTYANQVYSIALWLMVKNWELNQDFQLEGMAKTVFTNPKAESRAWLSGFPFFASPNMLHIPRTMMLANGSAQTWEYLALIWYQVQLILNNSEYQENGSSPVDWGYVYGVLKDLSGNDSAPQAAMLNLWLAKGMQINNNGIGPQVLNTGWDWIISDPSRDVSSSWRGIWVGMPAATRTAISTAIVQGWLASVQMFTPAQFYAGPSRVSATQTPAPGQPDSVNLIDRVWYMIPQFRYFGVPQTLINQMAAWAQTIWPNVNWAAAATATCAPGSDDLTFVRCSTEQ